VSGYEQEAAAANRLGPAIAAALDAEHTNHLSKLLALAAVTAAAIHAGAEGTGGTVVEIRAVFDAFLKQRLELPPVKPAASVH
jgi:hypothetical protein